MAEQSTSLCADRYHAVMGNFLLGIDPLGVGFPIGFLPVTFYVTERKIPFAPVLGHERMVNLLNRSRADEPRARFLAEDRAVLKLIAENLKHSRFPGKVSTVPEGTIVFANEPIAVVSGPAAMTQMFEVVFEYTFDEPMTWAYLAMKMKEELGPNVFLSDFSLRRAGNLERAVEASKYFYIGGCDDTSNMEAAFRHDIPSVGTMAHYLVQIFMAFVSSVEKKECMIPRSWYGEDGNLKHGERICFEYWLDAHPNGTVCLVDTIDLKLGMIHLIEAALSSQERRDALKAARLDSGDLVKGAVFMRRMFDANGLKDKKIILTGDLNAEKAREISQSLEKYKVDNAELEVNSENILESMGIMGEALGTKGVAEISRIAGIIFKATEFWTEPTLKLSGSKGKETLPGELQLWRCEDKKGRYILDVIGLAGENPTEFKIEGFVKAVSLIQPFWEHGRYPELKTPKELKIMVEEEKKKFIIPLAEYSSTRVVLSSGLLELKEKIQKNYFKTPPSNVKVVDWPE